MTKHALVTVLALLGCKDKETEPAAAPPAKADPAPTVAIDAAAVVTAPAATVDAAAVVTAPVDAAADPCDVLKDQGMESVTMGQHAAALGHFEASMKCRPDPYVVQLAFMASCNGNNATKAKHYYKQLKPAQQSRFKVMCTRNNVPFE